MGGGYLELGNLERRGVLVVWEIQSEGGSVKNAHHLLVGVVDFFWSNPMSKVPWILLLYEEF